MSKITPKQAFDAIKVLYPDTLGVVKTGDPKTVELLPPNETPDFLRMKFSTAVEIDWGNLTQYPEKAYRNALIDDIKTQPQAEFSDDPSFGNITSGKLVGYAKVGQSERWYCGFPNLSAIFYNYCRIPVLAPEPAPPEGWEIITEEHKKRWTSTGGGYAKIMTEGGRVYNECFWCGLNAFQGWRSSGIGWVDNPKYIRPSE